MAATDDDTDRYWMHSIGLAKSSSARSDDDYIAGNRRTKTAPTGYASAPKWS